MKSPVSLNLLLLSFEWSHQKLFLVKSDSGGEDLGGNDYQNTHPDYVDDCDASGYYYDSQCDTYDSYEVITATDTTTATITTATTTTTIARITGRLPANKACRGRDVGAPCIKRCCTRNPNGNCCARSKASSTCTIKDGRIKCLFPDHNWFAAPPAHGKLPANKACRGRDVGARCIKRCCTRNPNGNCCARSKASSTCTIKDGRIKCLFPDHNWFAAPPAHGKLPANKACRGRDV